MKKNMILLALSTLAFGLLLTFSFASLKTMAYEKATPKEAICEVVKISSSQASIEIEDELVAMSDAAKKDSEAVDRAVGMVVMLSVSAILLGAFFVRRDEKSKR